MASKRTGFLQHGLRLTLWLFSCSVLMACASHPTADVVSESALPWDDAEQLVLVITPDWNTSQGQLQTFERHEGQWRAVTSANAITVGRAGAAWGLGLHAGQSQGPQKMEGDGRAPAGVFQLGDAFGYADALATAMPYRAMQASSYCVDVVGSPLYNQIVDSRETGTAAVKDSTEPMRRDLHANGDQRYREGFVIQHNPRNLDGKGSCIFAHLWKAPGESTAGCTAMAAPVMQGLLEWLDPARKPVFVLLPRLEYQRLQSVWKLPAEVVTPS